MTLRPQEIYDRVTGHLLSQGRRSHHLGQGSYREGALRCAVGCLIPDDLYSRQMEGRRVRMILNMAFRQGRKGASIMDVDPHEVVVHGTSLVHPLTVTDLLEDLQNLHDREEPEDWPLALGTLAERYGLRPAEGTRTVDG